MIKKYFVLFLLIIVVLAGLTLFYDKSIRNIDKQSIVFQDPDDNSKLLSAEKSIITEMNMGQLSHYESISQQNYFLWGILFGLSILIFFINLFYFFSTNDSLFLRFGVYILVVLIGQILYSGLVFDFLFSGKMFINETIFFASYFCLYAIVVLYFHQLLVAPKYLTTKIKRGFRLIIFFYFIAFVFYFFIALYEPKSDLNFTQFIAFYLIKILFVFFVFMSIVLIYNGMYSKRRWKVVFYFGFSVQFLLLILLFFKINNTVELFFLENLKGILIIVISYLIDVFIFCYLLVFRYRNMAKEGNLLSLKLAENKHEINRKIIRVLDSERNHLSQILDRNVNTKILDTIDFLQTTESSDLKSDVINMLKGLNYSFLQIINNIFTNDNLEKDIGSKLKNWIYKLNLSQAIHFDFIEKGPIPKLDTITEKEVFRIIIELTNNILKHSQATSANITIETIGKIVKLKIADNGIGFDIGQSKMGLGHMNIHKRVAELKGNIKIDSNKIGTIVEIELAVQTKIYKLVCI